MTNDSITLAHGEGGWLTQRLIRERIVARLGNEVLSQLGDAAHLKLGTAKLAFSTDSFVVTPLFFGGSDIGRLSVFGTANDLAVSGAIPRWISLSFILEEGLLLETFDRILLSIAQAAEEAGVQIVTGDTKVVSRGAADQIFINTAGIGEIVETCPPGPAAISIGDEILVSGPLGQHGLSILAARENLGIEPLPVSDCAPLLPLADALRRDGISVRAMRDATRGGVAAVLHEWAEGSMQTFEVNESSLPVSAEVHGFCELLGLDPIHIANEGVMVLAVPPGEGSRALQTLRSIPLGARAAVIGQVVPRTLSPVIIVRGLGRRLALDLPVGSPLPRIC